MLLAAGALDFAFETTFAFLLTVVVRIALLTIGTYQLGPWLAVARFVVFGLFAPLITLVELQIELDLLL